MSDIQPPGFSIERMSNATIEDALRLCRESGWNQLQEDWQRLLRYDPQGCFVATWDQRLVGTLTTTRYGRDLGWIGMMLVHRDLRRQGIATALMRRGINYLNEHDVRCIKLDATSMGRDLYTRLGFRAEWSFHRWSRPGSTAQSQISPRDQCCSLTDVALLLDLGAFGADRRLFLDLLGDDSFVSENANGWGMLRPGFLASYLGPVSAINATAAKSIIDELCGQTEQSIFWDIPGPNTAAIAMARSLGFEPVRDFTRMWIGDACSQGNPALQYAIADPGTG